MTVLDPARTEVRVRPTLVLTALVLSVSVVLLGTTILNVALPDLTASLHLSNTEQQWVLNSYTLTFAGFLLIAGTAGDRFGLRQTLLVGLIGFTVTTALASIPLGVWFLIAMRGLMGVFAAAIMPTTLAIILRTFPAEKRAGSISIWAAASGVSISAGPLLGGALLSAGLWWGSVLVLVAVLALAALVISATGIHHMPAHPGVKLHVLPVLASVVGIVLLVWGVLDGGQAGDWLAPSTLIPLIAGIAILVGLVIVEARSQHPVADVRLFRNAKFTVAVIALSVGSFATFGYLYFTTFYLQVERGFTPVQAGLAFLPLSVGLVAGAPVSHRLSSAIGAKATMTIGLFALALSYAALVFVDGTTPLVWFLAEMLAASLAWGLVLTPATSLATTAVPAHRTGGGSALLNTLRQLASALGVAILGSLLWSSYRTGILPGLGSLPTADQAPAAQSLTATLHAAAGNAQLVTAAHAAFDHALHLAAIVAAALTLAAAVIALLVRPSSPASQHADEQ